MQLRRLTDKEEILSFLEEDRLYAAYAIGDLEPALFSQSEWVGAEEQGQLQALALLYKGLEPPALFLIGEPTGLMEALRLRLRPRRVYLSCRERHVAMVRALYKTEPPILMWRMAVENKDFRPVRSAQVMALSPRHTEGLRRLYTQGGGLAFTPTQLATGVFYGVQHRGRVVAAAGTHLVSPSYGMAAVGNVYTEVAHRGQGYGSATTSAVVSELFRRGVRQIVLNVAQTNVTAIRIYERLGFRKYCPFLEMLAVRRR